MSVFTRLIALIDLWHARYMCAHLQSEIDSFCAGDDAYDRHPHLLELVAMRRLWSRRVAMLEVKLGDTSDMCAPLFWRK